METTRHSRCCPQCSARLLPEETVCPKCANNTRLPTRRPCAWCGNWVPRGMVICRHCHADLAVPLAEPATCRTCGAPMSPRAVACIRCGTPRNLAEGPDDCRHPADSRGQAPGPTDATAAHHERSLVIGREAAALAAGRARGNRRGTWRPIIWRVWIVAGVILAAELLLLARGVSSATIPWPADWLDLRMTAWVVLHAGTFMIATIMAMLAAALLAREGRSAVWSPGALAFAAALPSLALPWSAGWLVEAVCSFRRPSAETDAAPDRSEAPSRTELLRTQPRAPWSGWTILSWLSLLVALTTTAALLWPEAWRPGLPPAALTLVDAVQSPATVWCGFLAVIGLGLVGTAAASAYWVTFREGGLVAWLTPVVLLAPLLVYLSVALLTGLGHDVGGPGAIDATTALRDGVLFWGFASSYGMYAAVTSWAAMRGLVVTSVIGYVLCAPAALLGWETVRRESHGISCSSRLTTLAAGLRRYAEEFRELPPPTVRDPSGQALYSWRVLVLPYVGEAALYERFHRDERWDSPHNSALIAMRPDVLGCDELPWNDRRTTLFVAVVGAETFFPAEGGVGLHELSGRGEQAVWLLEVPRTAGVPWSAPGDMELQTLDASQFANAHGGKPLAVTTRGKPDDLRPQRSPDGQPQDVRQRFWRPSAFTP